jgi:hypothetical protein
VPVTIEVDARDIGLTESPSARNGWSRIVIVTHKKRNSPITIRWKLAAN